MINNMSLILPHFYFNEANNIFMHCQIVQRAKDHKREKVGEGANKTYFIRSGEHLKRVMPEIILLCEHYGARAYINLAGKDFDQLQKLMLQKLAIDVCQGNIRDPRELLNSAAGELKPRIPKWVVDINNPEDKEKVVEYLDRVFGVTDPHHLIWERESLYLYEEIPTIQGYHLITRPFNPSVFNKTFPNIDVHKNSMGTLLYYPKSLNKE